MTRWAVVTGASAGIGLTLSERLLQQGRPVVAIARRTERLHALRTTYSDSVVRVENIDVRDRAALDGLASSLASAGDSVDVLVNNAGLSLGLGSIAEGSAADWQTMVDTNVTGVLNCTGALLPLMNRAGGAHLVNIGSLGAEHPYFGGNVYAATKSFVHHLSANLRVDLHGTGVRVTCVAPGMVRTDFALVRFRGDRDKADALYSGIRPLSADDVADAVLWALATPKHVNVNYIELMSTDQPYGLALRAPVDKP